MNVLSSFIQRKICKKGDFGCKYPMLQFSFFGLSAGQSMLAFSTQLTRVDSPLRLHWIWQILEVCLKMVEGNSASSGY